MFRRISILVLLSLIVSPLAFARTERIRITRSRLWEVDLVGNTRVLSREQPTLLGSVVVFHRYPDGLLIGIPQEQVVAVQHRGSTPYVLQVSSNVRQAHPLAPGEFVDLGETGAGPVLAADVVRVGRSFSPSAVGAPLIESQDPGRLAIDAAVFRGDTVVPGMGGGGAASQFGYTAGGMVLNPTLVNTGATPVTSGANGFPATASGQPVNPNGFPATTTTGPESGTQPINPNGFPAMTTTGPQSGIQPIDSNGFPSLTTPPNAGTGRSTTQPRGPSPR